MPQEETPHITRRSALLVIGFFLVSVLAIALVDGASVLWFPVEEEEEQQEGSFAGRVSGEGFLRGEPMRRIEHRLDELSRVNRTLRPYWSEVLYRGLRHTRETVVAGSDGWFYLARTVNPFSYFRYTKVHIPWCAAWADSARLALSTQGVDLGLIPIPSKVSVYPEHLPLGFKAPPLTYPVLVDALRQRGVWALDVLSLLLVQRDKGVFRKDDTHWTQSGSWLVTEALAKEIEERFPPYQPPVRAQSVWQEQPYQTGDLLRMAGFVPGGSLELGLRTVESRPFVNFESPRKPREIYLVGDSFAVEGNLSRFLTHALGVDIGDNAKTGRGMSYSLGELMEVMAEAPDHGIRLILWAFVERQLHEPINTSYEPIVRALAKIYAKRYREVCDLSDLHAGRQRSMAPFTACVLPTNGTTSLRFETNFQQARRVAVKAHQGGFTFETDPSVDIPPGAALTDFPLVQKGYILAIGFALDGPGFAQQELSRVTLCSAYHPIAELAGGQINPNMYFQREDRVLRGAARGGGAEFGLGLREPVPTDGSRAIGFKLALAPLEKSGAGRLVEQETGAYLSDLFPIHEGNVDYIIPLVNADRPEAQLVRVVLTQIDGDATVSEVTLLGL